MNIKKRILEISETLKEKDKLVFNLHYKERLTNFQIAQVIGRTESEVSDIREYIRYHFARHMDKISQ
jgi:DNA-directed RNA polymerase specialized sigma subunit